MKKNRADKIKELTSRAQRLHIQIRNLEDAERDEVARPALRKMIGQCFKFNNGYDNQNRWWLYAKIISLDEKKMTFSTTQFQMKSDKKAEVEIEQVYNWRGESHFSSLSWMPITHAEFDAARDVLCDQLEDVLFAKIRPSNK